MCRCKCTWCWKETCLSIDSSLLYYLWFEDGARCIGTILFVGFNHLPLWYFRGLH